MGIISSKEVPMKKQPTSKRNRSRRSPRSELGDQQMSDDAAGNRNLSQKNSCGDDQHTSSVAAHVSDMPAQDYRTPHPSVGPSPGFNEFPILNLAATADHLERRRTDHEMAQYWYELSVKQNDEIQQLDAEISSCVLAHNKQKDRAEKAEARCNQEKEKLEVLLASHVKAVNSVGSGLEPVTDQIFAERFEQLHHEVAGWCRILFKKDENLPQPDTYMIASEQDLCKQRVANLNMIRLAELLDCLVWSFAERIIFSRWLPGLSETILSVIQMLEGSIRIGDTADGERASIWNSQTASFIFQDPEYQTSLKNVSHILSALINVLCSFPNRPSIQKPVLGCIEGSLRSISTLAAEMRCQRGEFCPDESVMLGALYDEKTMEDVRITEIEDGVQLFVIAVLSKGWIRIPPKEVSDVERHICKARVLVKPSDIQTGDWEGWM